MYHEILADNKNSYRQWQLSETKDLASALAAHEYGIKTENPSLEKLLKTLEKPSSNGLTLQERLSEISAALISVADDTKFKGKVAKFIEDNQELVLESNQGRKKSSDDSERSLPLTTKLTL